MRDAHRTLNGGVLWLREQRPKGGSPEYAAGYAHAIRELERFRDLLAPPELDTQD